MLTAALCRRLMECVYAVVDIKGLNIKSAKGTNKRGLNSRCIAGGATHGYCANLPTVPPPRK